MKAIFTGVVSGRPNQSIPVGLKIFAAMHDTAIGGARNRTWSEPSTTIHHPPLLMDVCGSFQLDPGESRTLRRIVGFSPGPRLLDPSRKRDWKGMQCVGRGEG